MSISKTLDEIARSFELMPYDSLNEAFGVPHSLRTSDDSFVRNYHEAGLALDYLSSGIDQPNEWNDPSEKKSLTSWVRRHPYLTVALAIPVLPVIFIGIADHFDNVEQGIVYDKKFDIGVDGIEGTDDDKLTFKISNDPNTLTTTGIIDKDTRMENGMSMKDYDDRITPAKLIGDDGTYIKFSTRDCYRDTSNYGRPVCEVNEVLELSSAEFEQSTLTPKEIIAGVSATYWVLGFVGVSLYIAGKGISNKIKSRKKAKV